MLFRPEPQVSPDHYGSGYDHRRRFVSYWNQIDQVRQARPSRLLEIGIGNGFVSRYLREHGFSTHTVDFDERLRPDTIASVTDLPFESGSFDVACCFETLEHLPWDQFVPSLRELSRVASRKVLVSLPDVTPYVRFRLGYQFFRSLVDLSRDYPALFPKEHEFDGQHYWEIGKKGSRLSDVKGAMSSAGLVVLSTHRDYEDPFHRFFVCAPDPRRTAPEPRPSQVE